MEFSILGLAVWVIPAGVLCIFGKRFAVWWVIGLLLGSWLTWWPAAACGVMAAVGLFGSMSPNPSESRNSTVAAMMFMAGAAGSLVGWASKAG